MLPPIIDRHEESLAYFAQRLNDNVARVIVEAMRLYAPTTIGADRTIADELSNIFAAQSNDRSR